MKSESSILVLGYRGLVGSAIFGALKQRGFLGVHGEDREHYDLTVRNECEAAFKAYRPEYVFLAAAKVGGVEYNVQCAGDMIQQNLLIQTHVIDACRRYGVTRLCFLGSSCIYPKNAPSPIAESNLLGGPLEETNSAYAMAKIAGIEMCHAYGRQYGLQSICLMPTNLYGPNGFRGSQATHVIPMLMKRFHEMKHHGEHIDDVGRKVVRVWGTGNPRREFLHVDDLADAAIYFMSLSLYNEKNHDHPRLQGGWSKVWKPFIVNHWFRGAPIINVGTGSDVTIAELASMMAEVVGYQGDIEFDQSKPDGVYRKVLDIRLAKELGWQAKISLEEGLRSTYRAFSGGA